MLSKIWKEAKEWVLVLGAFGIISCLLFQPFKIPSGSMIPTFLVGDFLFVNKFVYGYSNNSFRFGSFNIPLPNIENRIFAGKSPERGDVVVFRNNKSNDENWIKRIIGLPGDKIQVIDGIVNINDKSVILKDAGEFTVVENEELAIHKRYMETLPNGCEHVVIKKHAFGAGHLDNVGPVVVLQGHYFMMGDNRDNSTDSRVQEVLGFVPLNNIIGRAEMIFFSIDCKWYEVLKWPFSIRYERILTFVK